MILQYMNYNIITGLAEAGLISSKLSMSDSPSSEHNAGVLFSPERLFVLLHLLIVLFLVIFYETHFLMFVLNSSPLCRQDLVSWKMALEKSRLPEVDKNVNKSFYLNYLMLYLFLFVLIHYDSLFLPVSIQILWLFGY